MKNLLKNASFSLLMIMALSTATFASSTHSEINVSSETPVDQLRLTKQSLEGKVSDTKTLSRKEKRSLRHEQKQMKSNSGGGIYISAGAVILILILILIL